MNCVLNRRAGGLMMLMVAMGVAGLLLCESRAFAADDVMKKEESKRPQGAPPEETVKDLLKKQYATSSAGLDGKPYYDYTMEMKEIKYGQPYVGEYRHDGVPPNTKTMVYPVKIEMFLTKKYNNDGTTTKERITGKHGFFQDSFGDWTYRTQESQREPVK